MASGQAGSAAAAVRLRHGATAVVGIAGAGTGLSLGVVTRLMLQGERALGLGILGLTVVVALVLLFTGFQAHLLARVVEAGGEHHHPDLSRRLLGLEAAIAAIERQAPAALDVETILEAAAVDPPRGHLAAASSEVPQPADG